MCCDVWCLKTGSLLGLRMLYFFFSTMDLCSFLSPKKTYPKVQTFNIVKEPWITYPYSCSICLGMPKYLKIQFKVIFLYDTIWGMVLVLEFLCDQIKKILYLSICAHGVLVLPLPPPSWAHWGRLGRSFTCTSLGLRTHDLLRW